jgi:bifunctional DNA-binding transcriptional regulator/antitoxin component of YhaV-PrlF toxin-antitoxin module
MGMGNSKSVVEEIDITRESEKQQLLKLDTRGRVTIPSSIRTRKGVDPEDDKEYWIELTVNSIEVVEPGESGGDE